MLPDEIYATSASSSNFKYSHPLNHMPVDDGALRARLAYDLMAFMGRSDCSYFLNPDALMSYDPLGSDDEIDILIVDGNYKEAEIALNQRLSATPDDDKLLFQQAFLKHLKAAYERILDKEEKILRAEPRNVNALINKGFALANLNREHEALVVTDKVLQIDPNNMIALGSKAYIAKNLGKDELREKTIMRAYNVSARIRADNIAADEARLLRDFDSLFTNDDMPSAFTDFNLSSGASKAIH